MRIAELRLQTARFEETVDFYRTILGLPMLHHDTAGASFQAGSTRLIFEPASQDNPTYHFAFNIPRDRFSDGKMWLASRLPLVGRDGDDEFSSESWNARFIYFRDTTGNIVELIARNAIAADTTGPFGPQSLLSVSEIGLPVDDVKSTVNSLTADLGISPYKGQSADFAPLGDEEGLLIVVGSGRNWFPTTLPARSVPLSAIIETPLSRLMRIRQSEKSIKVEPLSSVR
jgi:catechol 2,3-dioxygenase-like lactoylglutathione lyase family enzyme